MSCCKDKNQEKQYDAGLQSTCPIMGSPVDKKEAEEEGLTREYKGKKYYFCCEGCPEKFDRDPESYIEKTITPHDKEDKHSGCCH